MTSKKTAIHTLIARQTGSLAKEITTSVHTHALSDPRSMSGMTASRMDVHIIVSLPHTRHKLPAPLALDDL